MRKIFYIMSVDKTIILAAAAIALTLFGDSILYNVLPLYAENLGIPLVAVGVLLSINRWIRLLTNPLAARIFEKYGARKPLMFAVAGGVAVIFIYAGGRGLLIFMIARIIWGLCWSHLRLGNFLLVIGKAKNNLGLAMGATNSIWRIGSLMTVVLGGFLIDRMGYRSGMLIIGLAAVPAILLMKYAVSDIKKNIGQTGSQKTGKDLKPKTADSNKLTPGICYMTIFVNSFIAGFIISSLSLVLQNRLPPVLSFRGFNFGIATITGMMLAVRYGSYTILSPITGFLVDHWGSERTYKIFMSILMISLLCFALITVPVITLIMVCLLFFSSTALETILNTAVAERKDAGSTPGRLSVYNSFQDFGAASGPLLGYVVGVYIDFTYAYLMGVIGLSIILFLKEFHYSSSR